jgi:hypothetical protein
MLLGVLKINKRIIILITVFTVIIAYIFLYVSKPDYGGIFRCEKIFILESLSNHVKESKPFFKWELFEDPKFRFALPNNDYSTLKDYLAQNGYVEWVEGGVQYGSLNIGGEKKDLIFYSIKNVGKHAYIMVIDQKNQYLYAIVGQ